MVKKKTSKQERKIQQELMWIVGFFVFLVIIFLIASSVFKSFNKFEYEGLSFTNEKFGEIPVFHYYYYFNSSNKLFRYNLFLRIDPRKNDVPIEGDKIEFKTKKVYLGLETGRIGKCSRSQVSIATLSGFLTDNQLSVEAGNTNPSEAEVQGQEYITCENKKDSNVIQILGGDETKVENNGLCHTITVGPDCKILDAVEKFQVQSILDSKS